MNTSAELAEKYDKLFSDGKLVTLHISKWSMQCRLSKEDIGVAENVPESVFKLGNKMLINGSVLSKFTGLESQARAFLKNNSMEFPIAQAHFVPGKKLVSVVTTLQEYKEKYDILSLEFLNSYGIHKAEMIASYPQYKEALEPYYPLSDHLVSKFSFDIEMFEISIPKKLKSINLQEIKAQDAAVQGLKQKFELELESQYAKSVKKIDDFLNNTVYSLREEIVRVFETVADKINNREVITKTNITSLKGIIDNFKGMDFLEDEVISSKLSEVEALVMSSADFKEDSKSIARLGVAVNSVLTSAKSITDVSEVTKRYFRKITV